MDVQKSTFSAREDLAIVGVVFDEDSHEVTHAWVVPSISFQRLTRNQSKGKSDKWVMRTSLDGSKADRWHEYRREWVAVPDQIVKLLAVLT